MSTINSTAREGDLDRNEVAALESAEVDLARYVDPSSLRPNFAVDPDATVSRYSEANRVPVGQALGMYQTSLKALCTGERTRFDNGRVSLDVDGQMDGRTWSVPGPVVSEDEKGNEFTDDQYVIPQVVFCSLSLDSALFKAGSCEAIACHYLPSRKVVTKIRQRDGVAYQVSDDYFEGGYLGIARTFSSISEAKDARDDLVAAVRTYGRASRTARNEDVFEKEGRKAANELPSII